MSSVPTPDGWLDIHCHFFPPRPESDDESLVKALRDAHFMISDAPRFSPSDLMAYCDRAGIAMQMLSNTPPTSAAIRASNDYGLSIVRIYPSRFGLLAALPTDEPDECVREIARVKPLTSTAEAEIQPDGFAVTTRRNGVALGDERLRPVWEELDRRAEVVFVHPNAYAKGEDGRPSALVDVAFDTARVVTDMLYQRVFLDFPRIRWVFAHCGGAFPALSGRVLLLGAESWVPNPKRVTREALQEQISRLYVDTAATAATGLEPAIKMTGIEHVVYGADCGVPCSTEATMEENRATVRTIAEKVQGDGEFIGMNGFELFPAAKARATGTSLSAAPHPGA
jgi:predicted TIM-barrel fold metal-dependent hydrolase